MTAHDKTLIGRVQHEIERGANAAEKMHKAIADLPLKMLEKSRLLGEPAKKVRRMQDRAIGAVYEFVRTAAKRAGNLAAELVERAKRASTRAEHAAKPHRAHAA